MQHIFINSRSGSIEDNCKLCLESIHIAETVKEREAESDTLFLEPAAKRSCLKNPILDSFSLAGNGTFAVDNTHAANSESISSRNFIQKEKNLRENRKFFNPLSSIEKIHAISMIDHWDCSFCPHQLPIVVTDDAQIDLLLLFKGFVTFYNGKLSHVICYFCISSQNCIIYIHLAYLHFN